MNHVPNWLRGATWVVVVALYVGAWRVWTHDPLAAVPIGSLDPAEARFYGSLLRDLALSERIRSWQSDSLSSRQAAWIAVKAEYVLNATRIQDAKVIPDEKTGARLLDTWRWLYRARALSCFGAVEIPEESGGRLRAYWSPVDNSLQTYSLALPDGYSAEMSYPLIVSMHGHGWFGPYQGHPAPTISGALSLAPQGRGATDYMALGEDDVLSAIAEVCRDCSVDRERIYLRGGSMGGTGSWHLGVHYADRFAGIQPSAGNADYTAWQARWGWNAPFEGRNDELRGLIQESQTPRAFATNLLNLPAYVIHGSADNIVPVEHARRTVSVLRQNDCSVAYLEFPGCGHGGFPGDAEQEALAWLCGVPRDAHPRKVRWTADLMRQGTAYWVRLKQKRTPLGLAQLEAQAVDPSHVVVSTANLSTFAIRRDPVLFASDRPLFVVVDGERVIFPPGPEDGWLALRYLPGAGWRDASLLPPPPLQKTAFLEGPVQEALQAPFVLVLGTRSPDPLKRALWEAEVRQFASEWKRRNGAPCPFVRDIECTAELADSRNLILFGGAADNTVSAVLEPRLPLAHMLRPLTAAAAMPLGLSGLPASTATEAADVGWFMVYPNPEHPHRLVVILAAAGPEAIYQAWGRFGNWFNWGVHDSRKYFDYAVFDARSASPESLQLVGWFGTDWSVETGSWWLGSNRVRDRLGPQGFPRHESPPADATHVDLVDVRPARIDQMRGAVGFGRSFQGLPLPGCLGVRAPAVIEYDLKGAWKTLRCGGMLLNSPDAELVSARRKSERVRFIVRGDDRELAAGMVSWENPEVSLTVDVGKVKRLKLEAACSGGPAWLHMGAAWLTPSLSR